jgi:hypothetical protein
VYALLRGEKMKKYAFKIGEYVELKDQFGNCLVLRGNIRKREPILSENSAPNFENVYYVKDESGHLFPVTEQEIESGKLLHT